jgi:hypothetical protein
MALNRHKKVSFGKFFNKFPAIELPITLGSETHLHFSKNNDPLDPLEIEDFILPIEGPMDEFTEYIPCFSIPNTEGFFALVYWKASLMDYQYQLVTYKKGGEIISHQVIGGVFSNGDMIAQSMATIDNYWTIHVVTGQGKASASHYDPTESTAKEFELFSDGQIGELN